MDNPPAPGQPPQDDAAARFRTGARSPSESGSATGGQAPAPAPSGPARARAPGGPARPQTLGRMLEETLTAPLRLGSLFDPLALEPAPGYGLMSVNLMIYWTAMLGLNLVHVAIVHPQALKYPPEMLAAIGALSLVLVAVGGFVAAGVVEVIARAAGAAQSDYRRSYQVVSLLSALAPAQAAVNWLPSAWPIPILLGCAACAVALERLRKAPPIGSRVAMACFCAASLAAVSAARALADRALAPIVAAEQSAEQLHDMAAQLQQIQQASTPGAPGQPGASSLQMFKLAPGLSPQQQADQIQKSAAAMIGSMTPALNDPRLTKNLSPEQADMMKQVNAMLGSITGAMQTPGAFNDPKVRAQQQASLMQMLNTVANQPMPKDATPQQQAQFQQMQKMIQGLANGVPPQAQGQAPGAPISSPEPAGAAPQESKP